MPSGTIAAAVAPATKRAMPSSASEPAKAALAVVSAEDKRHQRDQAVLAEAVAERAADQLAEAIGEREGGRDHRGLARADAELLRDLRQQRIGDPHARDRDEGGGAEQRDRVGRAPRALGSGSRRRCGRGRRQPAPSAQAQRLRPADHGRPPRRPAGDPSGRRGRRDP